MEKRKVPVVSAVLTALAFVCFLVVYWEVTWGSVVPRYTAGLLFAIPFVFLLLLTFLGWYGRMSPLVTDVLSCLLAPFFVISAFFLLFFLSLTDSTITKPDYYPHALRTMENTDGFPEEIPENARNVRFYYTPQILQGSHVVALAFVTDEETISSYEVKLEEIATWQGTWTKMLETELNVVYPDILHQGRSGSPDVESDIQDFAIYHLYSTKFRGANHAVSCCAFVNPDTCEVAFVYEQW